MNNKTMDMAGIVENFAILAELAAASAFYFDGFETARAPSVFDRRVYAHNRCPLLRNRFLAHRALPTPFQTKKNPGSFLPGLIEFR